MSLSQALNQFAQNLGRYLHYLSLRQYHRTNRSIPDTYFGWAAPTFIIFVVANAAFAIISFVGAMMG